ncbi:heme ABC transporter ATP-binding protein [Microbacterium protaetiae]|uniref:Heme ABC transporter ATP-binding protein n=1 Tax=Microbacterium protaetiae TaxID=2509458 RepID=A0A4P6EI75_9MICO|nr:heme ABC transporter ATP-binding protein [Microbacterium protaetiae]QAY59857.1 heme ABC transporter ATP-binding protein [Microbacterium protaetiae]
MTDLALTHIGVTIGRRDILDDVSLHVDAGRVTAIIGPNGAGKSTLLAVAAGHRRPDVGEVRLGGDHLARIPVKEAARRRAVMPQDTTVAFPFTVREVVGLGRTAWPSDPTRDDRIVAEALAQTGLEHLAEREITTLSGGERQLTALARVIAQATPVGEHSVVLLDEPTAAMDVAHAEATLSLMRAVAADGAAVAVVLHDLDAAAAYADHLVLMHQGRVRAEGTVAEVCTGELLSEVYGTPIEVFEHGGRVRVAPRRGAFVVR